MSVFEFNSHDLQKCLQTAFEQNELYSAFRAHLQRCVPLVYSGLMNADTFKEETKAKKFIFNPFEVFLCDGDPDVVFKALKNEDAPSQLCGRNFKLGEPTYSCRDCGVDPTCVFCNDCFKQSVHKGHRYRMSTSGGGGYCDCGDVEAWKTEPYCNIHKQGITAEKNDPLESLPSSMKTRALTLFFCLIRSTTELLRWQHPDSLPTDLKLDHTGDTYVTMLFNDEVHTYEQVIGALTKAVNADQRKAVQFATTVDREGRSPVKDGTFKECEQAKEIIEKQTKRGGNAKPLKTTVMHTSVVAFQVWATRALKWLQEVTNQAEGLRNLFCQIIMEKHSTDGAETSILEELLLADTDLWKSARIQTHEIIMSSVLMDQECKKQFAVLFTNLYPKLMKAFMQDDHEHGVCAVSETVQIFTVPTLARMLITEHNVLEVILNTFLEECNTKVNDKGTFAFDKRNRNLTFRRAEYALYDLKYILLNTPGPEDWTDGLRKNFMAGFCAMLKLHKYMQNMDSVIRQTGQHIEFDPEWETAFNLQLKLEKNITLFLDWCGQDRAVLLDAYSHTVEYLERSEDFSQLKWRSVSCGAHTVPCIDYDIANENPVSVHVPLNRVLAGLFAQGAKLGLTPSDVYTSVEKSALSPEQMMEHCLRVVVLVAQSQAHMWKRNGYSLLNQIYFYQNVRCRSEMADRDVLMLQTGAALLDNNHFLIHVLNKFGLVEWARGDFDSVQSDLRKKLRCTVILAEEFLSLLLVMLIERYTEGVGRVTKDDITKHEVIHQLCLRPMAHSELTKALPDPVRETGIESVMPEVADFKKPSGSQSKGLYELKEDLYREYNPFFYHYSRQEQSAAMDAQKARIKQQNGSGPQALNPPIPPPCSSGYEHMTGLLNCDVMHYIFNLVLNRGIAKRSKSWSETQYEKVLFLIGLALYEEKAAIERGDSLFNFVAKASTAPDAESLSLFAKLEEYLTQNKGPHQSQRDLLAWVIILFQEVRSRRQPGALHSAPQLHSGDSSAATAASLESCLTSEVDEKTRKMREKKAKKAAARRAKILEKISKIQKDFIIANKELFENTNTELQRVASDMEFSRALSEPSGRVVALGTERSSPDGSTPLVYTCILCQEEQECTPNGMTLVFAAFVQQSTVLSQEQGRYVEDGEKYDPTFTPASLFQGVHTNTCGHVMHATCWEGFYDNVIMRERRRASRFRHVLSYDIENLEYLCPYCKSLSNTVIPILPYLHTLNTWEEKPVQLSFGVWLSGLQKTVRGSIQQKNNEDTDELSFLFEPCPLSTVTKMMEQSVAQNFQALFEYITDSISGKVTEPMESMVKKFSTDTYSVGLGVEPDQANPRVPLLVWNACAYTIIATEQLLRLDDKAVFDENGGSKSGDSLSALIRHAAVCSSVFDKIVVRKHCINLLSALLLDTGEPQQGIVERPCLLDMDMFHYLVALCLSMPVLYAEEDDGNKTQTAEGSDSARCKPLRTATGGLNDLHALRLTLAAHLYQILLKAQLPDQEGMETSGDTEAEAMLNIYYDIRRQAGLQDDRSPSAFQLLTYVQKAVTPFLRCCAMFFQVISAVVEPQSLKQKDEHEFANLCQFLALPTNFAKLFTSSTSTLISSWCRDPRMRTRLTSASMDCGEEASPSNALVTYPLRSNHLVRLPSDYSELIHKVSSFTCPNSNGDESRAPTMCLVCGEMLCSQSYCCQTDISVGSVGAATAHASKHGAGTGIFLRVRDCQILLLSGNSKGCFYSPPYLDAYGETDQGLRRGNPLYLCEERYEKLHRLWLAHAIPEQVARHLESHTALMSIEWNHL